MLRRGRFSADVTGQICQTDSLSRGGRTSFAGDRPPKSAQDYVIGTVCRSAQDQMHPFDPTWPQHGLRLGSTSSNNGQTWTPLAPSSKPCNAHGGQSSTQVMPKLGPSRLLFGPTEDQGLPSLNPSRLWLGQIRPLPSSLSNSLGAGCCRRQATRIKCCVI